MKNSRDALFVLLVVVAVGTERASLVWSAPQEDPADVVEDEGEPPDGVEDEEPADVVEDEGEPPDGVEDEEPVVVVEDEGKPPDGVEDEEPVDVVVEDESLCAVAVEEPVDVVEPEVEDPDGDDDVVWGDPADLRITEIMYHPPEPPPGTPLAREAFEYIELLNIGELPLDVSGMHLSSANGMGFLFPDGMVVAPGQRALAVKDRGAFTSAYEMCDGFVAGEYAGCLGDDGDFIVLADRLETTLIAFEYSDRWYAWTDGEGGALALFGERVPPQFYGKIGVWIDTGPAPGCASRLPEVSYRFQLPGDINQDASLDISDATLLLSHLFGGTTRPLPCEGTSLNYGGNLLLLDVSGDFAVDVNDVMYTLNALFGQGYPPVRGLQCIWTDGCPDNIECPCERLGEGEGE